MQAAGMAPLGEGPGDFAIWLRACVVLAFNLL